MTQTTISKLKRGQYFKLKPTDSAPVWVRGFYEPISRKYSAHKFDDINHEKLCKYNVKVYVGFTF